MNKFICTFVALAMGAVFSQAQEKASVASVGYMVSQRPSRPFFAGIQGGGIISLNENTFPKAARKVSGHGGVMLGAYFSNYWSGRLSVSFGSNSSACNSYETIGQGYYPYTFKSVNAFVDVIGDFWSRGSDSPLRVFYPRLYAGVGYAHTFGFSDSGHPWQVVSQKNNVLGFRLGAIGEFTISQRMGAMLDLCAEAYGDQYNGLQPSEKDHQRFKGYPGFPFDLRFIASLGVFFRF